MAEYYVDSDAGGGGDGSFGDPWNAISTNVGSLSAGDTMHLRGDVTPQIYTESTITIAADGSSGNEITITPYQAELVEIRNPTGGGAGIFELDGDYIVIDGKDQLTLNKTNVAGRLVDVAGTNVQLLNFEGKNVKFTGAMIRLQGASALLDGLELHDGENGATTDCSAILQRQGNDTVIKNCEIYDIKGDCVMLVDDFEYSGTQILDNHLYTTAVNASEGRAYENGMDIKMNVSGGNPLIVRGNTVHGFYACTGDIGGSGDGDGEGISIHNSTENAEVYENTVYDCTSGITVEDGSTDDVDVHNNLIYDLHTEGEDTNASVGNMGAFHAVSSVSNVRFYNNTIHDAPVNSIILSNTGLSGIVFKNNIFHDCGNIVNEGAAGVEADYTCWSNTTESIVGANDVTDDPLFASEAEDDYELQSGSPCIDAGVDVGFVFNGSAPDMGAFEYEGALDPFPMVLKNQGMIRRFASLRM